jgi:primase-polymerase (primpol)-like protein
MEWRGKEIKIQSLWRLPTLLERTLCSAASNVLTSIHTALGSRTLFIENGSEILDPEQSEDDHEDDLEGMYTSDCDTLDHARLTEEQAEKLRRRAKSSSSGSIG